MNIVIASLAFAAAALCAGLMGHAIQRGATCTVAAVDELMARRSLRRLASMLEASLFVAAGLLAARWLRLLPALPPGHALSGWTWLGGGLLGLGAWVNRACVFGAIARFGSGDWAYGLTPLGFFAGCLSVALVFSPPQRVPLAQGAPVLSAPAWLALPLLLALAWRLLGVLRGEPGSRWAQRIWSPHAATLVIGFSFLLMLLLVGAWAYTDVLAEAAHGMAASLPARGLLLLALLLGAAHGGYTAGRWRPAWPAPRLLARCFAGGVLMGWGSLLIPGGNDGLILVGMPLLWPYAWAAFAAMCLAIATAQAVSVRWAR